MMKAETKTIWNRLMTVGLLALLLSLHGTRTATAQEGGPSQQDAPSFANEVDNPEFEGGSRYTFPMRTSDGRSDGEFGPSDTLAINVWYGTDQTFGQLGTPQIWLNVLGNVSGPRPIDSLTYSLNDGPDIPLSIGPDQRRLYGPGEFNIELDIAAVNPTPGLNEVVVTADDGVEQVQTTVIVRYEADTVWPLPYVADWSTVANVNEAGQAVTGLWNVNDGLLENAISGYDQLLAIGDLSWTDYEVTVPVTVHSLNTGEWNGPSNGGGVGLIARWAGHFAVADEQPRLGWREMGVLAWYRWGTKGTAGYELRVGYKSLPLATATQPELQLGTTYIFKLRVESSPSANEPATYRFKSWEADQPEPVQWTLQSAGYPKELKAGSILLVANQAEVSFGNVTVLPLDFEGLKITVEEPENGTIQVTPPKAYYQPGESVEIEAIPAQGYKFAGWTGDLTGMDNPQMIQMTADITVGAVFEPETYQVYISPVASGSIDGLMFQRGDILRSESGQAWTTLLSARNGPFGSRSDVEAFTLLPDGSLLVALARRIAVPSLGMVMPTDVVRLRPGAAGSFDDASTEWYLHGSDVGLTTTGERIDALAVDGDGRLWISTVGAAKIPGPDASTLRAQDEDLIVFYGDTVNATSAGYWQMGCDGSTVPGLAREDIAGASVDAVDGSLYINTQSSFSIAGRRGTARDIIRLSSCSPDAEVTVVWNALETGFAKPYDAFTYIP